MNNKIILIVLVGICAAYRNIIPMENKSARTAKSVNSSKKPRRLRYPKKCYLCDGKNIERSVEKNLPYVDFTVICKDKRCKGRSIITHNIQTQKKTIARYSEEGRLQVSPRPLKIGSNATNKKPQDPNIEYIERGANKLECPYCGKKTTNYTEIKYKSKPDPISQIICRQEQCQKTSNFSFDSQSGKWLALDQSPAQSDSARSYHLISKNIKRKFYGEVVETKAINCPSCFTADAKFIKFDKKSTENRYTVILRCRKCKKISIDAHARNSKQVVKLSSDKFPNTAMPIDTPISQASSYSSFDPKQEGCGTVIKCKTTPCLSCPFANAEVKKYTNEATNEYTIILHCPNCKKTHKRVKNSSSKLSTKLSEAQSPSNHMVIGSDAPVPFVAPDFDVDRYDEEPDSDDDEQQQMAPNPQTDEEGEPTILDALCQIATTASRDSEGESDEEEEDDSTYPPHEQGHSIGFHSTNTNRGGVDDSGHPDRRISPPSIDSEAPPVDENSSTNNRNRKSKITMKDASIGIGIFAVASILSYGIYYRLFGSNKQIKGKPAAKLAPAKKLSSTSTKRFIIGGMAVFGLAAAYALRKRNHRP